MIKTVEPRYVRREMSPGRWETVDLHQEAREAVEREAKAQREKLQARERAIKEAEAERDLARREAALKSPPARQYFTKAETRDGIMLANRALIKVLKEEKFGPQEAVIAALQEEVRALREEVRALRTEARSGFAINSAKQIQAVSVPRA